MFAALRLDFCAGLLYNNSIMVYGGLLMLESWKRFHNLKTFTELFSVLTVQDLERIAAVPLLLFLLSPPIAMLWIYLMGSNEYRQMLTISVGIICLICCVGILYVRGNPVRRILSDRRPLLWFAAMSLLMLISAAVNGFTELDLHGDPYRKESLLTFISYGLFYSGCGTMIFREKTKRFLLRAFMLGSLAVTAVALPMHYGLYTINAFAVGRKEGTLTAHFYQLNHYAYYLMLAVIVSLGLFLFEKKQVWRVTALVTLLVQTFTLVVNHTRGCFVSCVCILVLTWVVLRLTGQTQGKRLAAGTAAFLAASAAGYFVTPDSLQRMVATVGEVYDVAVQNEAAGDAGTGRWTLWRCTVGYIAEKPLFGWGTEGIRDRLFLDSKANNNRPHCEYLQYAVFYGIPALLVYLGALTSIYRKAFRQRRSLSPMTVTALLAAAGYLVSAVFGNTMFYTAPFLFIFLGLGFRSDLPEYAPAASEKQ